MLYICVSTSYRNDDTHSARLCPVVQYKKSDREGTFINLDQSIWLSGSDAESISVGDLKDITYMYNDVKEV